VKSVDVSIRYSQSIIDRIGYRNSGFPLSGFQPSTAVQFFDMSSAAPTTEFPLRDRVQDVINLIRPAVQADGGDIELAEVQTDGTVHIRFHGARHGCPSSTMTLQMGIERNLRERVPEVTRVLPVQ
jgi:Fe-S cluster biogenesis protein NfuA